MSQPFITFSPTSKKFEVNQEAGVMRECLRGVYAFQCKHTIKHARLPSLFL